MKEVLVARAILRRLAELGVRVGQCQGKLRLDAPAGALSKSLLAQIARNKAIILLEVAAASVTATEPPCEEFDSYADAEREAIQWLQSAPPEEVESALKRATDEWAELTTWDWWDHLYPEDYARLTAPRVVPPPCAWCGGRLRHNPLCDELRASWEPAMPFGKYRGKRLHEIPGDYLRWLLRSSTQIDSGLRAAIEERLARGAEDEESYGNLGAINKGQHEMG